MFTNEWCEVAGGEEARTVVVKTQTLFEALGFQVDWEAMTDRRPAYVYDFGNLRLTAAEVTNRRFAPVFLFGGVASEARSLTLVNFEMPLEIDSFEQGVAWMAYGIGAGFQPRVPTPWLAEGIMWKDHLPWERERLAYERRPKCSVEKDWFRLAIKKLRAFAAAASERDLAWLAFDGELLRVAVCGTTVVVPAMGTAWDTRYGIKGAALEHLPKRLRDPVMVSIWDGKLTIGDRAWTLAQPEEVTKGPA